MNKPKPSISQLAIRHTSATVSIGPVAVVHSVCSRFSTFLSKGKYLPFSYFFLVMQHQFQKHIAFFYCIKHYLSVVEYLLTIAIRQWFGKAYFVLRPVVASVKHLCQPFDSESESQRQYSKSPCSTCLSNLFGKRHRRRPGFSLAWQPHNNTRSEKTHWICQAGATLRQAKK